MLDEKLCELHGGGGGGINSGMRLHHARSGGADLSMCSGSGPRRRGRCIYFHPECPSPPRGEITNKEEHIRPKHANTDTVQPGVVVILSGASFLR